MKRRHTKYTGERHQHHQSALFGCALTMFIPGVVYCTTSPTSAVNDLDLGCEGVVSTDGWVQCRRGPMHRLLQLAP